MHYSNLVIIKASDGINHGVAQAMGPDEESGGFWDWYEIGGRWEGVLNGQNTMPVDDLTEELLKKFYRIVTADHGAFTSERFKPWYKAGEEPFEKLEMPCLDWIKTCYSGYLAVVVDNHS